MDFDDMDIGELLNLKCAIKEEILDLTDEVARVSELLDNLERIEQILSQY
jgi:hypothetical protein